MDRILGPTQDTFWVSLLRQSLFYYIKEKTQTMDDHIDKYDGLMKVMTEGVVIGGKTYFLKDELEKFYVAGNKKAGTRIRKIMQMIKSNAQFIREDVQAYRKSI